MRTWRLRGSRGPFPALVIFVLAGLVLAGHQTVLAEESSSQEHLPDRFMVRGGYAYVFNADTTFAINGSSGLGALVDLSKVLKAQREDSSWRIDSLYRFNPKHSIGFSYYDVNRKGNAVLSESITIGLEKTLQKLARNLQM